MVLVYFGTGALKPNLKFENVVFGAEEKAKRKEKTKRRRIKERGIKLRSHKDNPRQISLEQIGHVRRS